MVRLHGPNREEHPRISVEALYNVSKNSSTKKNRVRGLPGAKTNTLLQNASHYGCSLVTTSQPFSQNQLQEAIASEVRTRLQQEHEEWTRRREEQFAAERAQQEAAHAAQVAAMQSQIDALNASISSRDDEVDRRVERRMEKMMRALRAKGLLLSESSDEDSQDTHP